MGDLVFYDGNGQPWFRMDEQRRDVPLDRISPWLQKAVISTEDRRFWYHPGIDPLGLARAVIRDLRDRRDPRGRQHDHAAARAHAVSVDGAKRRAQGKEAAIALLLEERLSKAQILELYLNRIYLSAGIYGVETDGVERLREARQRSDDRRVGADCGTDSGAVGTLPLVESRRRAAAKRRRAAPHADGGFHHHARRPRPQSANGCASAHTRDRRTSAAGTRRSILRQQFRERFGGDYPADWQVRTTILPGVQDAGEAAIADGLRRLGKPGLQAALVALDPNTGNVLAIVGGSSIRDTPFNRAWRSRRQPGSAFKPFVFAAALMRGMSPVTIVDGLGAVGTQGEEEWSPRNARGEAVEALTLRQSLIESNNRAAVALQERIGTRPILRLAAAAGLRNQPDVPSLALGSGLVTPLDLAAAYSHSKWRLQGHASRDQTRDRRGWRRRAR